MGTIQDMIRKIERFQQEIKSLSTKKISIIPDKDGMIDRQCPKKECLSFFKVNCDDWKNLVKDEEVFCPFCRNASEAGDYFPKEQKSAALSIMKNSIMDHWNNGRSISHHAISLKSKEEFELKIECEKCGVRFSVIGAAYFCPCCGYNSIERTANTSIEKLIFNAENITLIQKLLEQTFTKDEAATIAKIQIENSLGDCISTLQTFSETKYNLLSTTKAPPNAFQNCERSNKLWMELEGQGYETWLIDEEAKMLLTYTQRRHLLEHKGGLVDSKYLQITNDRNYRIAERIIVKPNDVIKLGAIVLKIIDRINKL